MHVCYGRDVITNKKLSHARWGSRARDSADPDGISPQRCPRAIPGHTARGRGGCPSAGFQTGSLSWTLQGDALCHQSPQTWKTRTQGESGERGLQKKGAERGSRVGSGGREPGVQAASEGWRGKVTTSPVALPDPRAPAPPARTVGPATFVVICCSCRRALDPVIPARPRLSPVPEASHGLCCAPGCSVAVDKPSTDTRCRPASGLCRSA